MNPEVQARRLLQDSGCYRLPVSVDAVAAHLGAKVSYEDFEDDLSGVVIVKDGKRAIGVNKHHHPNRQRFTIAHEIGHLVLHYQNSRNDLHLDKKWSYFRAAGQSDKTEIEANRFAAELLMPATLLKDLVTSKNFDLDSDIHTSELARSLAVSEQALAIRLVDLKLASAY